MACIGGIWLAAALAASGAGDAPGRARPPAGPSASAQARQLLGLPAEGAGLAGEAPPGHYQTDLPGSSAAPTSVSGDGYQTELPHPKDPPRELSLRPLERLLKILFWTAVGVVAVLAVVGIARWLLALRARRRGRDAVLVDAPRTAGPVAIPIGDAEALAAQGDYAEAIHALLLRTLEALSRAARLSPALTSREIVGKVPLQPRARLALRGLVHAVEVSRFGGAEPGQDDYRACRERFDEFLATYGTPA